MGMRINNNMGAVNASHQIAVNGNNPSHSQRSKNAESAAKPDASFSNAAVSHNNVANRLEQSTATQQASESRIRDVEKAREVSATTRDQIINQSSAAMSIQANMVPQNVQDLLR